MFSLSTPYYNSSPNNDLRLAPKFSFQNFDLFFFKNFLYKFEIQLLLKILFKNNIFLKNSLINPIFKIFVTTFMRHGYLIKYMNYLFKCFKHFHLLFSFKTLQFFFHASRKILNPNFIFLLIPSETILFSFEIHKLDKKLRKNLKNKGLKFKFLWKYLPPFKRFKVFTKWLKKEIFFSKLLTFKTKFLFYFLLSLILNAENFIIKNQKFINSFIYKNFFSSLALSSSKLFSR